MNLSHLFRFCGIQNANLCLPLAVCFFFSFVFLITIERMKIMKIQSQFVFVVWAIELITVFEYKRDSHIIYNVKLFP